VDSSKSAGGFEISPVGIARDDKAAGARQVARNYEFFGTPHVAIVTTETSLGVYGVLDCGAFVNTFVLAARSRGVASIAQASLAARAGFLRTWFGIPDHRQIVCGISFGYEDASDPVNRFRTTRVSTEEACTWIDGD
jgi:nitroreductase